MVERNSVYFVVFGTRIRLRSNIVYQPQVKTKTFYPTGPVLRRISSSVSFRNFLLVGGTEVPDKMIIYCLQKIMYVDEIISCSPILILSFLLGSESSLNRLEKGGVETVTTP